MTKRLKKKSLGKLENELDKQKMKMQHAKL